MNSSPIEDRNSELREILLRKTEGLIPRTDWLALNDCGRAEIYRTCKDCGTFKTFYYRCSKKYCPLCNWMISRKRSKLLSAYASKIQQPKHVVLTQRNFTDPITRTRIHKFKKALVSLKRSALWKSAHVNGGCWSLEVTNDFGRNAGWHLHAHGLVDCRFIDYGSLAKEWGWRVGQEFGIVHGSDCRGETYLQEVVKYVVKPEQMVKWPGELIHQFIRAVSGRGSPRMFTTFGSLFKLAPEIRKQLNEEREPVYCGCGSCNFKFETEQMSICNETKRARKGQRLKADRGTSKPCAQSATKELSSSATRCSQTVFI